MSFEHFAPRLLYNFNPVGNVKRYIFFCSNFFLLDSQTKCQLIHYILLLLITCVSVNSRITDFLRRNNSKTVSHWGELSCIVLASPPPRVLMHHFLYSHRSSFERYLEMILNHGKWV